MLHALGRHVGHPRWTQQRSTLVTQVARLVVAAAVQAVVQQVGRPVRQQGVALHLAKADAATHLAALDGLHDDWVDRTRRANLGGEVRGAVLRCVMSMACVWIHACVDIMTLLPALLPTLLPTLFPAWLPTWLPALLPTMLLA